MDKNSKKYLFILGTRPEAIKLCPLILKFRSAGLNVQVCSTGQHSDLVHDIMDLFGVAVDFDLDIIAKKAVLLAEINALLLKEISDVLNMVQPDCVFVQGDTSSAMMGCLAAFYLKIPVHHVEAGLRSDDIYSPFPEEINRKFISLIAKKHFVPTKTAACNLQNEGILDQTIHQVGNTVIDAVKMIEEKLSWVDDPQMQALKKIIDEYDRFTLVTSHRRENWGQGLENICKAVSQLAEEYPNMAFLFPVHPNPIVKDLVFDRLGGIKNVHLSKALSYSATIACLNHCFMLLTDSGGLQEEATAFCKPVLILRENTERTESVDAGIARLVGTNAMKIVQNFTEINFDKDVYARMSRPVYPYGDGTTCQQILDVIQNEK